MIVNYKYETKIRKTISSEGNRKRIESIKEFIKTEKAYVKDLEIVHEVFEMPLRKSKIISNEDIDSIFLNWQEIIHCNKSFLEAFLKAYNTSETIGDVISEHVNYHHLQKSLTLAETFLSKINENVRLRQTEKQMNWLQDSIQNELNLVFNSKTNKMGLRKLLNFGVLKKLKSGKELICFLFNDFLMFVQCSKTISHGQFMFERNSNIIYKMYKQPILIQNLSIIVESQDNLESGTDSNRVLNVQDTKSKYKISLVAATVHECTLWFKTINSAKEDYIKVLALSQKNRWKTQFLGRAEIDLKEIQEEATNKNGPMAEGQTVENFLTELKKQAKVCDFYCKKQGCGESYEERMVRVRLVMGLIDKQLQARLIRKLDLTVSKIMEYCKSVNLSKEYLKTLNPEEEVYTVYKNEQKIKCPKCLYEHYRNRCPAFKKTCAVCQEQGHYAKACKNRVENPKNVIGNSQTKGCRGRHQLSQYRSREVREVIQHEDTEESDDEQLFVDGCIANKNKLPSTETLSVEGHEVIRQLYMYKTRSENIPEFTTKACPSEHNVYARTIKYAIYYIKLNNT
nr:unnamed protein product [Callosobruchus analis]